MENFEYHRPDSIDAAVAQLRASSEAKLVAGGMSLVPAMKLDLAAPSGLVSLSGVSGLDGIVDEGDSILIGATATHASVAASDVVRSRIPGLAAMAGSIGDPQVRNRGTLGGSVAHNDPAADYPAALIALGATVVTDRREIGADSFFTGMFETALDADEIVTGVRFPVPARAAYAKFAHPASKYAIVGVMVAETGGAVRVAVTGAGTSVFRVPDMEAALGASFSPDAIAGIGVAADGLMSDGTAGAAYRAHLVGVMARRAVASIA